MKYIVFLFVISAILSLNVYADTCSYKNQTILNNDLANVKITYEIVDSNQINILIYNITENIFISYKYPNEKKENKIYYSNTNNGKYVITRDASTLEEYIFQIKSDISECYGNILSTKKIIKPKYNEFHTLEICSEKGLENHSYCQEFITIDIKKSEEEVKKTLKDFLNNKVSKVTTTKVEEKRLPVKEVISYSLGGLIVISIIVIIIIIKKKKEEL